jgi:tetratricopeptide (TPR) repeat protein
MSRPATVISASEALEQARLAVQRDDIAGARAIAEQARTMHPGDAPLADMAGDLALKEGDAETAARHFAAAYKADPKTIDYALNHAIALQRLDRHGQAIALLYRLAKQGRLLVRYGNVRALSERALGRPAQAAQWYDAALAAEPRNPRALHGRARVALERGEADAVQRFDAAIAVNSGDADLWLGKAQALDVAGDVAGARTVAARICAQAPGFIAALSFLSGLKLAGGEADFTAPFAEAAARIPQDPNIPAAHAEALAGLDHAREAADIAAAARKRFSSEPHFALLEAVHAGSAGEWDRADAIFSELPEDFPGRALHETRHRLRAGQISAAEALLERVLAGAPWDISAWALRGIAWRLGQDTRSQERAQWLHEQAGLVQLCPLVAREGLLDDVIAELQNLHEGSAMPLGQSLRGGTQTRAILFHRTEPLLGELHQAICDTLETYRGALPLRDDTHPLLRHRGTLWQLAGSWSVRLTGGPKALGSTTGGPKIGGDYHTAHIHPQGIISSALYLVVPQEAHAAPTGIIGPGWLEVGRPPPDLGLNLPPIRSLEPQAGQLALFPSTLYHGTTPFGSGAAAPTERLTVAFDVVMASA